MNLSEIPTPETDAVNSGELESLEIRYDLMHDLASDLEQRLTVARTALKFYQEHMLLGYGITDSGQVAEEALTLTAPKP